MDLILKNINRVISITFLLIYFSDAQQTQGLIQIDTSRFMLKNVNPPFFLIDNFKDDSILIEKEFIMRPKPELDDENNYVSSFLFSEKVTAFGIGNELIGIHLFSFDYMKEGSAQAAEGRDIFFMYNPKKASRSTKSLEFGITKSRYRYMGCFYAKTSHFILEDVNKDGLTDIGQIREEFNCNNVAKPFFRQLPIKWYLCIDSTWSLNSLQDNPGDWVDLPLLDIKLNPVDVIGFNIWRSYDPKDWQKQTSIYYYPNYRLKYINSKKK